MWVQSLCVLPCLLATTTKNNDLKKYGGWKTENNWILYNVCSNSSSTLEWNALNWHIFLYSLPIPFFVFLYFMIIFFYFISFYIYLFLWGGFFFTCCYPLVWLLNRVTEHNLFFYFYKIVVILLIFLSFISFIFSTDLFSASLSSLLLRVRHKSCNQSNIVFFFE